MKPHKLTLQGFTGIESGLSKSSITLDLTTIPEDKQLVAIVGPNGKGKTTLLDNMHPYRVMPSRSTTLGPGGFSYWNHISGSCAAIEFDWEHAGRSYRKAFSFKTSGKTKKADYYLFEQDEGGRGWIPVRLQDGTLSDGKAETYDQCVDSILGPPERFFTSQFSAQKRRGLSDYGASEVKALLASILDLLSCRKLSAKAGLVAKLLKTHLENLHDDIAQSRGADEGINAISRELTQLDERMSSQSEQERILSVAHQAAQHAAAALNERRNSVAKEEEERTFLVKQLQQLEVNRLQAHAKLQGNFDSEQESIGRQIGQVRKDKVMAQSLLQRLVSEVVRLDDILTHKAKYLDARAHAPLLKQSIAAVDLEIERAQQKLAVVNGKRNELSNLVRTQAEHNTAGQAKKIAITRLEETSSLVKTVPCHSSEWQSTCPLLAHANEALNRIAPEQEQLSQLREKYVEVKRKVDALEAEVSGAAQLEQVMREAINKRTQLVRELESMLELAGKCDLIEQAESRKPEAVLEKGGQEQVLIELASRESAQTQLLDQAISKLKNDLANVDESVKNDSAQLQERLSKLAAPIPDADLAAAEQAIRTAAHRVEEAKAKYRALSEQKVSLLAKVEIYKETKARMQATVAEAARLSEEIAKFKLLEKGLGNDGLVALSIDDSGPEISRLCNELLVEDYEGRFAVRLDTQRETLSGEMRETFQITVFDSRGGPEKALDDMSGGEQVWVNECLTRAIALYVGQTGSCSYQTLFTDEADGALDPERKRQFIQMKRSVLKRGGYSREYFISQTPELWELADHIIDLDKI